MRRSYVPFAAGMTTMLLLVGLVGASLAGETAPAVTAKTGTISGQVAYGETGVALFGKEQVPAGATRTTEAGAWVPTVLTYTDEKGEDHYFINADTAAEVLDVVYGAVYREDINCVDFGTLAAEDAEGAPLLDEDGQPVYWTGEEVFSKRTRSNADGTQEIIAIGDMKTTMQIGDVIVTTGGELEEGDPLMQEHKERLTERTPTVPEYGVSHGVFTEVDPAELDPAGYLGRLMDRTYFAGDEVTQTFSFMPELPYAALVIENAGEEDVMVQVLRPWTVGSMNRQAFTTVRIPAGETIQRAFRVTQGIGDELQNKLAVKITSVGAKDVQVRLSSEQYGASTAP